MARIYPRQDRRGRNVWYIDYTYHHPETGAQVRKKERIGYDKSQAQSALESRLTDIRRRKFDGILPEPACTLRQIWPRYLRHSKATKSERQVDREKGIIDCHLMDEFGDRSLHRITAEQLESYQARRIEDGAAPATVNKEVQLLKNIVSKAVSWKLIRTNQVSSVKPLKAPPGRVRYLEPGDLDRVVQACPPWLRPIVVLGGYLGLRRGEVCDLKWENIDRKNGLIRVEVTKNGESKILPMNRTVRQALDRLPRHLDTPFLFAEEDGSPISKGKVTVAFKRASKRTGIDDFHFHDLRHHFASWLTMNGHNQRTLMELLGHKDPKMTVRYQHLSPEHLKSAVESLDRPLGGESELREQNPSN